MSETNERSVASDGSALCVWGWVQTDWDGTEFVIPCSDQCEATHRASRAGKAVQFFPKPTLTDAEREAVEWAIEIADSLAECSGAGTGGEPSREAATLRALLARLEGDA